MGRFETLNDDTKDLVEALLPALAKSFGVTDCVDLIPEDIRMRAWDCERRDHIKDQTENEPRNWGVQFLKDLMAISRIKKGDLAIFQADLRKKVEQHEEKHPWCRLGDIKELKDEYMHPNRPKVVQPESDGTSSTDSYLEELHEPNLPPGMKRGRHEIYEARVQESHKRKKCKYLTSSQIQSSSMQCIANVMQMAPTAASAAPKKAASSAKTRRKAAHPLPATPSTAHPPLQTALVAPPSAPTAS